MRSQRSRTRTETRCLSRMQNRAARIVRTGGIEEYSQDCSSIPVRTGSLLCGLRQSNNYAEEHTLGSNVVSMPDVRKISDLITALSGYAVKSARKQWAENMSLVYTPPRLRCWDEHAWSELSKDRDVVDYLVSDSAGAWVLVRSLYFCVTWYGQAECDRLQSIGRIETK